LEKIDDCFEWYYLWRRARLEKRLEKVRVKIEEGEKEKSILVQRWEELYNSLTEEEKEQHKGFIQEVTINK
jgi:ABC-type siderophore export system fused ATPase/permease subunit